MRAPATREVLAAVLEHVAGDESLLLVVAATHRIKPEAVMQALHISSPWPGRLTEWPSA